MKANNYLRDFIYTLVFVGILSLFSLNANAKSNWKLIKQYKAFKRATGCKFIITSSKRSVAKNKAVGGASHSFHLSGKAYDLVPNRSCKKTYYQLSKIASKYFSGVILYESHIHVDVGSRKFIKIVYIRGEA